jgi:hypothetical protein
LFCSLGTTTAAAVAASQSHQIAKRTKTNTKTTLVLRDARIQGVFEYRERPCARSHYLHATDAQRAPLRESRPLFSTACRHEAQSTPLLTRHAWPREASVARWTRLVLSCTRASLHSTTRQMLDPLQLTNKRHQKEIKKNSDTGNRTPVSRVTGGDTSHYTMSDYVSYWINKTAYPCFADLEFGGGGGSGGKRSDACHHPFILIRVGQEGACAAKRRRGLHY